MQINMKKAAEQLKEFIDLGNDKELMDRNIQILNNFNRQEACTQLKVTSDRFKLIINAMSFFTTVHIQEVEYVAFSDKEIKAALYYLTQNIPLYVLAEKTLEDEFKRSLDK